MTRLDLITDVLGASPRPGECPPAHQWEGPLALAAAHDLLPALWSAGRRRGWWSPLPNDALTQIRARFASGTTQPPLLLQQAYDANRIRTDDLTGQGQVILDLLAAEGITAVPLKGFHTLLAGWWPDPSDRVMRDLDILVAKNQADRAAMCLTDLGYLPFVTGHTPEADHELPAVQLPGHAGSVELHTALVVNRWHGVLAADEVLKHGALMSTTDAVIHSIAHAQLQDEAHLLARIPLRALYELSVLTGGSRAGEIEWDQIRASFRRISAEGALDAHLAQAISLFDASVPEPVGRFRADTHDRLCRALLAHPPLASVYERTVFLPRGLSTTRMHELHGPGNPWISRIRHIGRSLVRSATSHSARE